MSNVKERPAVMSSMTHAVLGFGKEVRIRPTDNIRFLPLFYLIPEDFFAKRKQMYNIPRCPYDVLRTEKYRNIIDDDVYVEFIIDVVAWVAWHCFEVPLQNGQYRSIPGDIRDYSGYNVIWKIAYMIPGVMVNELEGTGWCLQWLYLLTRNDEVPWMDYEFFWSVVENMVEITIKDYNLQPIIDYCWKNKALEDFDQTRSSYVRTDFERQWYHSRSKRKVVSIEEFLEDYGDTDKKMDADCLIQMADPSLEYEDKVVDQECLRPFLDTLTDRDMEILELRNQGYTLQEIAEKTGYYKNHSGVKKRLDGLGKRYDNFIQKTYQDFLETH